MILLPLYLAAKIARSRRRFLVEEKKSREHRSYMFVRFYRGPVWGSSYKRKLPTPVKIELPRVRYGVCSPPGCC